MSPENMDKREVAVLPERSTSTGLERWQLVVGYLGVPKPIPYKYN